MKKISDQRWLPRSDCDGLIIKKIYNDNSGEFGGPSEMWRRKIFPLTYIPSQSLHLISQAELSIG